MRPYVRFIRFSVEPHPLAPPLLAPLCYNRSMDANPHNPPAPNIDPPHQGVVIEDYRGPLLSQPQTRSGVSTSGASGYSAPMFAASPLPEWLAEQPQPPQPTRLRRWSTRIFSSDADETLNTAKRGLGWMLVALLGFSLVIGTLILSNLNPQFDQTTPYAMIGWTAPLLTLICLPAALLGSIHSLREAHFSSYPRLVRRISLISLFGELIMVAVIISSIIWAIIQIHGTTNCFDCLGICLSLSPNLPRIPKYGILPAVPSTFCGWRKLARPLTVGRWAAGKRLPRRG